MRRGKLLETAICDHFLRILKSFSKALLITHACSHTLEQYHYTTGEETK